MTVSLSTLPPHVHWQYTLSLFLAILSLSFLSLASAAPQPQSESSQTQPSHPECTFSCPPADQNGHHLTISSRATPYSGPYSIFDCVYLIAVTPASLHTCRYYKTDGLNALGTTPPDSSACHTQAVPCAEGSTPMFSTPEKIERLPWVGYGFLEYRLNGHW